MPPVPQLCPLWSLPVALFPGDAGRFGKLGAFPELGVRDSGLVYTHRESEVLFPRSHGSIICFYVASPGLWPPVLVMLRCQAHYFSSEQSKARCPSPGTQTPIRWAEEGEGSLTLLSKAERGPEAPAPSGHFHSARGRSWRPARGWAVREPSSAPRPATAVRAQRQAHRGLECRSPTPTPRL